MQPLSGLPRAVLLCWYVSLAACGTSAPGQAAAVNDTVARVRVVRRVSDGVFTGVQAERGGVLYQSFCQECHQPDLSGAKGPALMGTEFLQRWGAPGLTVADLFGFVTSLMPEYEPGSLTEQEYADVLAFILQENGYGAGPEELARDMGQLETVVLDPPSTAPDSGRRQRCLKRPHFPVARLRYRRQFPARCDADPLSRSERRYCYRRRRPLSRRSRPCPHRDRWCADRVRRNWRRHAAHDPLL